uniref:Uncharacterized protein n=1 Tax=Vespula pensylvanica TaxID=30213 RepID=A0A834U7K0_VESPE|nr:hypothetical protein H0235_010318 [Vespula pensylvanica]
MECFINNENKRRKKGDERIDESRKRRVEGRIILFMGILGRWYGRAMHRQWLVGPNRRMAHFPTAKVRKCLSESYFLIFADIERSLFRRAFLALP